VRSPYAQHHLHKLDPTQLHHISSPPTSLLGKSLSFLTPERGIGQGDVTSAVFWLLVFDILLTSLDLATSNPPQPLLHLITTPSSSGTIRPSCEICFSDDLTSVSPNYSTRQLKANIVSAFAIIFKLTIAQDKLRSLVQEWGNEPLGPNPGMTISLPDETISPPLLQEQQASIISLGVNFDTNNSGTTQHHALLNSIRQSLSRVLRVKGSTTLKLKVIKTAFFPSLTYRLQYMQWDIKAYGTIKKALQHYLYKILKLYKGFPSALIYTSTTLGGFGLPDITIPR